MSTRAKPTPPPDAPGDGAESPPPRGPDAAPGLPSLDFAAFRRRLAGLADPSTSAGALTPEVVKQLAIRFVSVLADLFNRDALDPLTLWDRIGSALATADAKAGDDADRFVSECLEHVKAEPGRAAASPALGAILGTLGAAKPEDRSAFLAYLRMHRYPALAFGRQRWERVKAREVEL